MKDNGTASLPLLKNMVLPSLLTITRGVKIKKEGISIHREFREVEPDERALERYKSFFNSTEHIPLTFFYLWAQRAQAAVMLQPDFTIAVPGLVHVSNRLEQIGSIQCDRPFDLTVNVAVPYKEEGSLLPRFAVRFIQDNATVIVCESTYLAKRKRKKKQTRPTPVDPVIAEHASSAIWEIPKNAGRSYARASGDVNPIHISKVFAKLAGFKLPILQGWYSVARIVAECERETEFKFRHIEVDFKSPIYLPSRQRVERQAGAGGEVTFRMADVASEKTVLYGRLK